MISKEEILNLEPRRKIYSYISKNPGLHLRELYRRTKIPFATLRYHLSFLKKNGLLIEKSENHYSRYYAINNISSKDKKLLNILRNKRIRQIILVFYWEVATNRICISKHIGIPPTTVGFYLKKLKKLGIIEVAETCDDGVLSSSGRIVERPPVGREVLYRLKDYKLFWNLFVTYKSSFHDDFTTDLLVPVKKNPDRFASFDSRMDQTIKLAFEFFPIPFCA